MQGHSNEIDAINSEYRSLKNENMRLEIVCKEFQEKVLAGEQFLNNYKSIQDENRKLYNLVQDLRGNIRVFCRCGVHWWKCIMQTLRRFEVNLLYAVCCMQFAVTAKHWSNHVFHQCFVARSRTTACTEVMSRCWQEQGNHNPSFGSTIVHHMVTLHIC